jgi:hypothetical protein
MAYPAVHDQGFFDRPSQTPRAGDQFGEHMSNAEFIEHLRTYRGFVKGMMLFAGHILAILILLAFFLT